MFGVIVELFVCDDFIVFTWPSFLTSLAIPYTTFRFKVASCSLRSTCIAISARIEDATFPSFIIPCPCSRYVNMVKGQQNGSFKKHLRDGS